MTSTDQKWESFSRAYNEIWKLYDEEEMQACVDKADDLLGCHDLPRYHRIKTLILLGCALEEWHETEKCRREAEGLWALARRYNDHSDPNVEEALAELRTTLDQLKQHQIETQLPYDDDDDNDDDEREGAEEFEVLEVLGGAERDGPEKLAAADQAALDPAPAALAEEVKAKMHLQVPLPDIAVHAPPEEELK